MALMRMTICVDYDNEKVRAEDLDQKVNDLFDGLLVSNVDIAHDRVKTDEDLES